MHYCQILVAHACSYSGGRDKKKISQKRAGGVAQSEGPEFKPQYLKTKKHYNLQFLDGTHGDKAMYPKKANIKM
jgi:hypothetical protein